MFVASNQASKQEANRTTSGDMASLPDFLLPDKTQPGQEDPSTSQQTNSRRVTFSHLPMTAATVSTTTPTRPASKRRLSHHALELPARLIIEIVQQRNDHQQQADQLEPNHDDDDDSQCHVDVTTRLAKGNHQYAAEDDNQRRKGRPQRADHLHEHLRLSLAGLWRPLAALIGGRDMKRRQKLKCQRDDQDEQDEEGNCDDSCFVCHLGEFLLGSLGRLARFVQAKLISGLFLVITILD